MPVLAVQGRDAPYGTLAQVDAVAARCPAPVERLVLEGCGHAPFRDRPEAVEDFLNRYGNPYSRIGSDNISSLMIEIGASGVPETYVIDAEGNIRYQHIGDVRAETVPILLEQLEMAR